jgi:hypothetical protein
MMAMFALEDHDVEGKRLVVQIGKDKSRQLLRYIYRMGELPDDNPFLGQIAARVGKQFPRAPRAFAEARPPSQARSGGRGNRKPPLAASALVPSHAKLQGRLGSWLPDALKPWVSERDPLLARNIEWSQDLHVNWRGGILDRGNRPSAQILHVLAHGPVDLDAHLDSGTTCPEHGRETARGVLVHIPRQWAQARYTV